MSHSAAPAKKAILAKTLECRALGGDGFLLRVNVEEPFAQDLEGGHFFMLRTGHDEFPFLSRPFSVHDTFPGPAGPELQFLFKVVGAGTRCLSRLQPEETVELVGPLGCPFPAPDSPEMLTILVAGGVGLPPLHLLLRNRQERKETHPALLLYGARQRDQLFALETLDNLGIEIQTATEDGSHGRRGRVDRLLEDALQSHAGSPCRILTCGPDPMMERVAELARQFEVPCWASLETPMACGFGVCNACAVPVEHDRKPGYRFARACLEGPVLPADKILWDFPAVSS